MSEPLSECELRKSTLPERASRTYRPDSSSRAIVRKPSGSVRGGAVTTKTGRRFVLFPALRRRQRCRQRPSYRYLRATAAVALATSSPICFMRVVVTRLVGPHTKFVREIEEAVQQGKKVVRSMLGYSRDGTDDGTEFSLPELVEDTVGLLSKQFLSGITLDLELDRDLPKVQASRSSLEQILLNLIVNASESMKGKGTLRMVVGAREAGQNSYVLRPRPANDFL